MKLVILGKHVGYAEGWDQTTDTEYLFYSVDTNGVYPMLDGDVCFDWADGKFKKYNDKGIVDYEAHAFDVLK